MDRKFFIAACILLLLFCFHSIAQQSTDIRFKRNSADSGSIAVKISHSHDDTEETSRGFISRSSSDLDMVSGSQQQTVGLRFTDIRIPKNALITRAYVQFTADKSDDEYAVLMIGAPLTGHASHFYKTAYALSSLSLMPQQVRWEPDNWLANDSNEAQQTPELKSLVQPVINHTDWHSGNAIVFIITGEGLRTAKSFDVAPANAAKLFIEFERPESEPLQVITATINADSDDAEQNPDGDVDLNSSDLELVENKAAQVVGLRFTNIRLPSEAEVIDARIQFESDEVHYDPTNLTLTAELTANATPFKETEFDISNRIRTASSINWQVASWRRKRLDDADQLSPNITPLINEVIKQTDWAAGNSMAFIIEGSGKRIATSFDRNPRGAAKLVIKYK